MKEIEIKISPAGLLDIEGAALYLGCSVTTMRFLRRLRRIPFAKVGQRLYVRKVDLDGYVDQQLKKS